MIKTIKKYFSSIFKTENNQTPPENNPNNQNQGQNNQDPNLNNQNMQSGQQPMHAKTVQKKKSRGRTILWVLLAVLLGLIIWGIFFTTNWSSTTSEEFKDTWYGDDGVYVDQDGNGQDDGTWVDTNNNGVIDTGEIDTTDKSGVGMTVAEQKATTFSIQPYYYYGSFTVVYIDSPRGNYQISFDDYSSAEDYIFGNVSSVAVPADQQVVGLVIGPTHVENGGSYISVADPIDVSPVQVSSTEPYMGPGFWATLFLTWLPWVLFFVLGMLLVKKIIDKQQGAGKISKNLTPQLSNIRFSDISGYPEVKVEMMEIVDFLKNPARYTTSGVRTPKGVLLTGAPGTGKTLWAKAIAGEAGVPFYSISGSDFVELYVGVGASRVRSLFQAAKDQGRAIIFIDEIDAVGRQRGAGVGGGNDEREQTLNQLLVELDGFLASTGVVVLAATNRPDVLDPALKRPGRFDREIEIRLPDVLEREAILRNYASRGNKVFSKDVDFGALAIRTPGFSGAELENVINEAAILTIRWHKNEIDTDIIDEAIDRVMAGPSKPNLTMSEDEKKHIAFHEAGHAVIGLKKEKAQLVQKITIVPRGQAGGYVLMTPKKEKMIQTKSELLATITSYMGGRVAEEIYFGEENVSTGASADIQEATQIARRMVTEWGMSSLGPIQYEERQGSVFLGREMGRDRKFSSEVGAQIDKEVKSIINEALAEARKIIKANGKLMELIAEALIIKETINAEEIKYIDQNEKLPPSVLAVKEKKTKKTEKTEKKNDKKEAKSDKNDKVEKEDSKAETSTDNKDIKN